MCTHRGKFQPYLTRSIHVGTYPPRIAHADIATAVVYTLLEWQRVWGKKYMVLHVYPCAASKDKECSSRIPPCFLVAGGLARADVFLLPHISCHFLSLITTTAPSRLLCNTWSISLPTSRIHCAQR